MITEEILRIKQIMGLISEDITHPIIRREFNNSSTTTEEVEDDSEDKKEKEKKVVKKKDDTAKWITCRNCKHKFTQTIHKKKKSLPICPTCLTHNN